MDPAVERIRQVLTGLGAAGPVREFTEPVPTALAAAEQLGCDVGAIANSMVFDADGSAVLVLVSGAHRADLKLLAGLLGVGKVRRATPELVLAATGQQVGGVAPVGHPAPLSSYVYRDLTGYAQVWAGAGTEHAMFATTADELVRITHGQLVDVTRL